MNCLQQKRKNNAFSLLEKSFCQTVDFILTITTTKEIGVRGHLGKKELSLRAEVLMAPLVDRLWSGSNLTKSKKFSILSALGSPVLLMVLKIISNTLARSIL